MKTRISKIFRISFLTIKSRIDMLIMLMAMVIFLSMTGCSDKEADPGGNY